MPRLTLDNSFRFGSRRETVTNFHSESIETILKKLTKDWLGQFARGEPIQADLIGWKKILVKINEVLDVAVKKQMKEESVKKWLSELRDLACDVDHLLDEFQTEAFQRMLLQEDADDAVDKSDDSMAMSKVKDVNARLQDIASQIELLGLGKKSRGKSRNVHRLILPKLAGGRDPGAAIYSHPGLDFSDAQFKIFTKSELVKATKNYDESHCLGRGAFGSVYKGALPDNTQVAVKRPEIGCLFRINQAFQHKLRAVSQINHKNVVKILGVCLETKEHLLVYEFISNRTLFNHIHDKKSRVLKSWKTCLRIAAETASALDYLHTLARPPIVHGFVNSTNIFLDDNYTVKVADFGFSLLLSSYDYTATETEENEAEAIGWIDREYRFRIGELTKKTDVHNFGVVLIELLTGKHPLTYEAFARNGMTRLDRYFPYSIENNSLRRILNFQVADQSEMEEIKIVAKLASKCLGSSSTERPTMRQVSEQLDSLRRLHENFWAQKSSEA